MFLLHLGKRRILIYALRIGIDGWEDEEMYSLTPVMILELLMHGLEF